MDAFFNNPELLVSECSEMFNTISPKAYLTIGVELQRDAIEELDNYRKDLSSLKKKFVEKEQENEANLLYCLDQTLKVLQLELKMLVSFKEDKMSAAWENLVNSQVILEIVVRNCSFDWKFLEKYSHKLNAYEKLLFPNMYFNSIGGIIKKSECSICGIAYGDCTHLKGKLYMGELCCQIISEIDLEEVSIVDNPANKHCRMLSITGKDGKTYDLLTHREIILDNPE